MEFIELFDWQLHVKLAVIVVGVTQWVKSLFQKIKIPTFVWAIFMSLLAVGVVFAEQYCPIINVILLVICISQLGYEFILQNIKRIVSHIIGADKEPSRNSY